MVKILTFILLISPFFLLAQPFNKDYTPVFESSEKSLFKIDDAQKFTFGYLKVPENRNNSESKMIELPVYIFKSRSTNPKPDPIIFTVGGPGSTTMPSAKYMEYYQYLDDRDFILIEQRGNYYARPHLDCPEWSDAIYQSNLPDFDKEKTASLLAKAATDCRNRLVKKGIDLNGYNTNEIAADIFDLKRALEIKSYNLLTMSYSTKIAQVMLRDYPEGIRSVVMDSPLPLASKFDEESNQNLMENLNLLLDDCTADTLCNKAFPNLKARFLSYLQQITESPLKVSVENPKSGKEEIFFLRGEDLIAVFTNAYTSDVPNIPVEINMILNNDLSSVKAQLIKLFNPPKYGGDGIGMRLSVWCAEEYPFDSQETITKETKKYPEIKGLSPAVYSEQVCEIWGVEKVSVIEDKPVSSEVPVLLINGQYDELTPPKWAKAMQEHLKNSFHLVFKGWKHGPITNWGNPCAMQAANDFFNNPYSKPNPDCFKEITRPVFLTKEKGH